MTEKKMEKQISMFGRDSWFGKTFPAHSAATGEKTFKPYYRKSCGSQNQTRPMCLCLKRENGQKPGRYTMKWEVGQLLGEYTTRSFGERPSVENVSRLSQILTDYAPQKYYLSAKACAGILNRAKKRGKELPPQLEKALTIQAKQYPFKNAQENPGGGKGILIQNERTGALAAGRNQAVATFRKTAHARTADEGQGWEHTDTADCINVNDQTDGHTPNVIVENKTFAFEGNGSRPSHHGDGFQETETMFTLNAVERHGVLRVDDIAGALCSDDHKGANNGFVSQNKLRITGTGVRRLTPLECERLQGFPDGWTDIGEWTDTKGKTHKESSDAARYKALGNSIAVGYANHASGFWCWLLKRISAQYERNATLGSLFDGIGGFPLAWEHYNGKGSAVWASEIEEFPIAVTKRRFGGE